MMPTTHKASLENVDVKDAVARMRRHASKTKAAFGKSLKKESPSQHGRLAGSSKP